MRIPDISRLLLPVLVLLLGACGGGGGGTPDPDPVDRTPDSISFTASPDLLPGTRATSGKAVISGLDEPVEAAVSGGELSINDGAWTDEPASAGNGDSIRVRGIAGDEPGSTTDITLAVGEGNATFSIPTAPAGTVADTRPHPFELPDPEDVEPGSIVISDPVIVSGINTGAAVTVAGPEGVKLIIDGEPVEGLKATIFPGQAVQVSLLAPAESNAVAEAVLTIGDVSETFTVIIPPAEGETDIVPDPVTGEIPASGDPEAAEPDTYIVFGPIPVTGIAAPVPVAVENGGYSLDGGATWSDEVESMEEVVTDGSSLLVRVLASEFPKARVEARLVIGGIGRIFAVTTRDVPEGSDTEPDAFGFGARGGVLPGSQVLSDPITITGIDAPAPISIEGGEYRINGGQFTAATGVISEGQQVEIRVIAANEAEATVNATLIVGTVSAAFKVTTSAQEEQNQPPVARINGPEAVDYGQEFSLDGGASSDADGEELVYKWSQVAGPEVELEITTDTVLHVQAPDVDTDETVRFRLTVSDGVNEDVAFFDVDIRGPDTVPDQFSFEPMDGLAPHFGNHFTNSVTLAGFNTPVPVNLTATGGIDPGKIDLMVGNGSFESGAPVGPGQSLRIRLTSHDPGTTGSVQVEIGGVTTTVDVRFATEPDANAGDDLVVAAGAVVELAGSGTDDTPGALTFRWSQVAGLPLVSIENANSETATFTAPALTADDANVQLQFRLAVTNADGVSGADVVFVTVLAPNTPPVADAGPDQQVDEGAEVMLDGTGSDDADGQTLSYSWEQTRGPAVELSDANAGRPTFTLDNISQDAELEFRLTVDDGNNKHDSDLVKVLVANDGAVLKLDFPSIVALTDAPLGDLPVLTYRGRALPGDGMGIQSVTVNGVPADTFDPETGGWTYTHRISAGSQIIEITAIEENGVETVIEARLDHVPNRQGVEFPASMTTGASLGALSLDSTRDRLLVNGTNTLHSVDLGTGAVLKMQQGSTLNISHDMEYDPISDKHFVIEARLGDLYGQRHGMVEFDPEFESSRVVSAIGDGNGSDINYSTDSGSSDLAYDSVAHVVYERFNSRQPDGSLLSFLWRIDLTPDANPAREEVLQLPSRALAFDMINNRLLSADCETVSAIDTANYSVSQLFVDFGICIEDFRVDSNGMLWAINIDLDTDRGTIEIIDLENGSRETRSDMGDPVLGPRAAMDRGASMRHLVMDTERRVLYILDFSNNSVDPQGVIVVDQLTGQRVMLFQDN